MSDKFSYPKTTAGTVAPADKGTDKCHTKESPSGSKGSGLYCHKVSAGK